MAKRAKLLDKRVYIICDIKINIYVYSYIYIYVFCSNTCLYRNILYIKIDKMTPKKIGK